MNVKDLLSHPALYRLWQAPFARQKLQPVNESGSVQRAKAVLDVGCGPGTNARAFSEAETYVGIDLSEKYVAYASERFGGDFRVVDVTKAPADFGRFDLVLMNSLMHHLDDQESSTLLASLPGLLERSGEVHIVDLVLAEHGIERRLARADRGAYARSIGAWRELIEPFLDISEMRSFSVGLGPLALWELVYIRCSAPAGRG